MPNQRSPGVYIEDESISPPAVSEVETAIPAFVGYTQIARRRRKNDLVLKPAQVTSLQDFEKHFGFPNMDPIAITVENHGAGGVRVAVFKVNGVGGTPPPAFLLYHSVKLYFENGGGKCWIVSVGTYPNPTRRRSRGLEDLRKGLNAVGSRKEPALLVIPDAVKLRARDYAVLTRAMLARCGELRNRFAILDVKEGATLLSEAALESNRAHFGTKFLSYGAVYYPFVRTSLRYPIDRFERNVSVKFGSKSAPLRTFAAGGPNDNAAVFGCVKRALNEHFVSMPPCGAIAGVYAATDAARGVWRAPANVGLAAILEPRVKFGNALQDLLNVDPVSGKSINAIRFFSGKGTLVWGARTLAGNDNEWRYIPVRRFCIMVEQSLIQSTQWVVFEPNDAQTWLKIRAMIEDYLMRKWRAGALAGTKPEQAFFVRCGFGATMTAQDILEGRLVVEIGMAPVRPAEFIILRFTCNMKRS